MVHRLVVPVDGSTFSERALQYAGPLARASGGALDLVLVHVRQTPASADLLLMHEVSEWEQEHRQREADYLERLRDRVVAEYGVSVRAVLLDGDVVAGIERHLADCGGDLVVLTSHGRAGLERAWLGSVSDALLRKLDVPVLLIRPSDTEPAARGTAEFRHVLVALDGSERAEHAIGPALALVNSDARVTLLRVTAPEAGSASPHVPHALVLTREQVEATRTAARQYVADVARRIRAESGREVLESVVVDYHPAHAILDYAEVHSVDLIAVGTHGRNPIARMLLGSVSDKIVRAAGTPVLVC